MRSRATKELIVQCDEMWSYCGNKQNKQWVWIAMNQQTREVVGLHIGGRTVKDAYALWKSLPQSYQENAFFFTDFYSAYNVTLPTDSHQSVSKNTGLTNYIERFNNTLRQRVARLARKTLSFSKKTDNHIASIWYFVHYYNASLKIYE